MKTYNDHTDIGKYPGEKVEDVKNVSDDRFTIKLSKEYEITYLPKGFKLGDMSKDETGWEANYYNEDEVITFSQSSLNGTDLSIDTENTKNTYVDINGQQAFVTEKDEQISVTWRVDENIIRVTSIGVKKAELIKLQKALRKLNNIINIKKLFGKVRNPKSFLFLKIFLKFLKLIVTSFWFVVFNKRVKLITKKIKIGGAK